MKIIARIGLFFLVSVAFAQPPDTLWMRTYGEQGRYEECRSIFAIDNSNVIIAGSVQIDTSESIHGLIRSVDSTGGVLWEYDYPHGHPTAFYSGTSLGNDRIFVCGRNANMAYIMCINSIGDTVWTRTINANNIYRATSLFLTSSDQLMVIGLQDSPVDGRTGSFLAALDEFGQVLWIQSYFRVQSLTTLVLSHIGSGQRRYCLDT